ILFDFSWTRSIFSKGYRKDLEESDLYNVLDEHKTEALGDQLEENWKNELMMSRKKNKPPSLQKALIKTFWKKYAIIFIMTLINYLGIRILQTLLMGRVIHYFSPHTDIDTHTARMYGGAMIAVIFIRLAFDHHYNHFAGALGMEARVASCALIYRKQQASYLGKLIARLRKKVAVRTDERMRLMNEIVSGIQVIKMYAWEKPFAKLVEKVRRNEISKVTFSSYLRGFYLSSMVYLERSTLFATLLAYVLMGFDITAEKVFTMAQFFNLLNASTALFYPVAVESKIESTVSVIRIQVYLRHNLSTSPSLNSSLLHAIMQELPLHTGSVSVGGNISYASQEPWLFVGTVRQNILFGQPYKPDKYKEVVRVCALQKDFDMFRHGDKTLVGEKGISLSGGQRARINLARAVYRNADVYLLDDPLSAVDTHVGKHLFEECIIKNLGNKTRILVTHQLQFIKDADLVIILNNGEIENMGTFTEMQNIGLNFAKLLAPSEESESEDEELRNIPLRRRKISEKSVSEEDFRRRSRRRSSRKSSGRSSIRKEGSIKNSFTNEDYQGSFRSSVRRRHLRQPSLISTNSELLLEEEAECSPSYTNILDNGINNNKGDKASNGLLQSKLNGITQKGVSIVNGCAKWGTNVDYDSLRNITFRVPEGKLCAVIGPVGSGKSSLLHAIMQELPLHTGSVSVGGNISYASQEPWLFVGTVRQNILFGQPYKPDKYKEVVRVCALQKDFDMFRHGDKTLVGEKGISLSGGQRARINLARAVYRNADVYLLDDPLSAVDTHVGKHLFEECIIKNLGNKTRILVTHQLQFIKDADLVIILNNSWFGDDVDDLDDEEAVQESRGVGTISWKTYWTYFRAGGNICFLLMTLVTLVVAQISTSGADYWVTLWTNEEEIRQNYREFRNHPNETNVTVVDNTMFSTEDSLGIYAALIAGCMFVTLLRSIMFVKTCMSASINLHNNMFASILRGAMRFFDTNPSGRILNRFSKDIGAIDELLPRFMLESIQVFFVLIGILVNIAIVNPYFIILMVFLGICYYGVTTVYLSTSRNVKRLEGITRSPVYSHLSDTMTGLTTIRVCGAQDMVKRAFDSRQDEHTAAWSLFVSISNAFGFWMDILSSLFVAIITLTFFLYEDTIGAKVGLALSQALIVTGMLQYGLLRATEVVSQMTAVERVLEYTNIQKEPDLESTPGQAPVLKDLNFNIQSTHKVGIVGRTGAGKSSLITALFRLANLDGSVDIDGVNINDIGLHDLRRKISIIPQEPVLFSESLRHNLDPFDQYPDDALWNSLEEVDLKAAVSGLEMKVQEGGANFSVGQRQLICLARAILRNNKILVLDEATANVDPDSQNIYERFRSSQFTPLVDYVMTINVYEFKQSLEVSYQRKSLLFRVRDEGGIWNAIVFRTDTFVQETIRRKFKDCTVLTIAHRLNTIMDSDRVMVMDAGSMVEYDHPYQLLQNRNGYFYKLVQETGPMMAQQLYKIAETVWK
ncbi:hypothetical protein C0J52_21150, partial [Blattella germanica]